MKSETQQQIERLQQHCLVELGVVEQFHSWLDLKRGGRQACRVVGDSRTGKTIACNLYLNKHLQPSSNGEAPIVPVMYLHAPTESGPRELFVGLLEYLQYRITRGTIAELRDRVYRLLKACQVEMIILDEAHRLRPKHIFGNSRHFRSAQHFGGSRWHRSSRCGSAPRRASVQPLCGVSPLLSDGQSRH